MFDSDASGSHDFIGSCQASLRQLRDCGARGQGLPLVNPKKRSKPGYVSSGALLVKGVGITPRPSFLDYVRGGLALNFVVAVDFTGSNGDPHHPASLHFNSPSPTIYEGEAARRS